MSDTFPLVFSVTSGKGGVGKTNISVNLAICLAQLGKQVVLIDADLGLANVDVVLGLTPQKNIFHLFHEGATISDILFPTPYGFSILPASSGMSEMLTPSTGQKLELLEAVDEMEDGLDYLIVDTGAGISDNVLYFNMAAQERLVVLGYLDDTADGIFGANTANAIRAAQEQAGMESTGIADNEFQQYIFSSSAQPAA